MVATQFRRAVGVFAKQEDLEQALNELKAAGFSEDHISIIARDAEQGQEVGGVEMSDRVGDTKVDTANAAVTNTANTSAMGAIGLGLTSLAIPGVGPILAAGSLAAALAATTVSTGASAIAANNLVRALIEIGIPEENAGWYGDRLHRGDFLVVLEGSEQQIQQAQKIFADGGGENWVMFG